MAMDYMMVYDLIYAIAALDGREAALFGKTAPVAREAFMRGLCGSTFPELWFELPLAKDPWFDLHMLYARHELPLGATFVGLAGIYADALKWFAQSRDTRQLALSFDTRVGETEYPAVQLLLDGPNMATAMSFLAVVGIEGISEAYRSFIRRLPKGWYACYSGVFPVRPESGWVRVECIVGEAAQQAYAIDPKALRKDLSQIGMRELNDTLLSYVSALARSPFPLELQFNVGLDGDVLATLGASVCFQQKEWIGGVASEAAGSLFHQVEKWGFADERWKLLAQTAFGKRLTHDGCSKQIWCFPAFVKLRWQHGEAVDAKTYLMAGLS